MRHFINEEKSIFIQMDTSILSHHLQWDQLKKRIFNFIMVEYDDLFFYELEMYQNGSVEIQNNKIVLSGDNGILELTEVRFNTITL
jgi:hypothetical protein